MTRPRTVLLVLVGAHAVNDFYATILPAFLPALATEFDLDYTQLGTLSFAFILLSGVLQPVIGSVADRSGRRRWFLTFGFVIAAIGFVAMSLAPTFWFIVTVSLLCGLGAATYHPQATAFVVSAFPKRRGRMLGIHGWGGSVGHFLAPAVVVVAVSAISWRVAMAAIAIPMIIAAVTVRATLGEGSPTPGVTLRGAATRQIMLVALTFGLLSVAGRSFLVFFVKMLVDEGWSDTRAGVLLAVILLGGAIAQPLGGWAFDRFGGRPVFVVAATSTAAFIALFAVTSGALSLVAIAGVSFFQFSMFPVALAQASQLAPTGQTGAATGIVFGVSGLMTAAAQPFVGAVAESLGEIRAALAWLLPVAILGIVVAAQVERLPHDEQMVGHGHNPAIEASSSQHGPSA